MNYYIDEKMLQERRREMLAESGQRQLIAAYEAAHPPVWVRLQVAFGNTLIRWGSMLVRRSTNQFDLAAGFYRQRT